MASASATLVFKNARRASTASIVIPAAARQGAAATDGLEIRFEVPRIGPPGTNSEPVTLQLRLEALRLVGARQGAAARQRAAAVETQPERSRIRLAVKRGRPRWRPAFSSLLLRGVGDVGGEGALGLGLDDLLVEQRLLGAVIGGRVERASR